MEYRKEYGGSADMSEEQMLSRVLSDMDATGCRTCSCNRSSQNTRTGCGSRCSSGCGCNGNNDTGSGGQQVSGSCVAGSSVDPLSGFPLAMAYVPNQPWEGIQEPEQALSSGTLFTGLLFPWHPSRCGESRGCGCGRN